MGFDGAGRPAVVTRANGLRELLFADKSAALPPIQQAPVMRFAPDLGGYLMLRDEGGNERYRLLFQDLQGSAPRQLSPSGARVAGPLIDRENKSVIFASTAGQGPLWGVLTHTLAPSDPSVLFQEGGAWQPMDVSASGRRLLLQQVFGLYDRVLYMFDQETGLKTPLFLGQRPVAVRDAVFRPDGARVFTAIALVRGGGRIIELNMAEASFNERHRANWPLYDLAISADGRTLAALENRNGASWLLTFDLSDDEAAPSAIDLGGWATDMALGPDGTSIGLTLASPGQSARALVLAKADGFAVPAGNGSALCAPVAYSQVNLPRPAPVGSFDSLPIKIITPTNAQGPLPVLLAFHGGPESQWVDNSHLDYVAMASHLGAAVLLPNVLGSTGYGLLYSAADDGADRKDVPADVAAILRFIDLDPRFDAQRVVATGASYGGYLALLSLAQFPNQIDAAISQVGITHLPSFLSETPLTRRSLRRAEYGDERDRKTMKVLDKLSPLTLADQIQGPVLLIHGENDARVLVGQAQRMAQTLRGLNKPVTYLELASTGHVVRSTQTRLKTLREKAAFLESVFAGP